MKKKIFSLVIVFLLMMTTPALAELNFNINGREYVPQSSPVLKDGITRAPAQMLARTLGADLNISENEISLVENDNTLTMTIGSQEAFLNEDKILMPVAPEKIESDILLPLRFVFESFGATVDWTADSQTVKVDYIEKRNDLTADEILTETTRVMQEANSYKMLVDMDTDMDMLITNPDGTTEEMSMNMLGQIDGSIQYSPMLMYMVQHIQMNLAESAPESEEIPEIVSEILMNEDEFYMTMPEQGWIKMDLPDMPDMNELLKQSMAQDPLSSVQQMKELGMAVSYGNDFEKEGKTYWTIDVTMNADSLDKLYSQFMPQVPGMEQQMDIQELFKNMKMDMSYRSYINPENMYTEFMDLNGKFSYSMNIPTDEGNTNIACDADIDANYHLFDYGLKFDIPDVSNAKSFTEFMKEQENKMNIMNIE